jgi:hypothetical protein
LGLFSFVLFAKGSFLGPGLRNLQACAPIRMRYPRSEGREGAPGGTTRAEPAGVSVNDGAIHRGSHWMSRPRCGTSWLVATLSSALVACAGGRVAAVPDQKSTAEGMSFEQFLHTSDPEAVIAQSRHDVIVARVLVAAKGTPTNGTPPVVEIEVQEVLSGKMSRAPAHALWEAVPHDVDWVGSGADARIAEWAARPLPGPAAGTAWILVGSLDTTSGREGIFRVSPRGRFEYSEQRRAWALRALAARTIQ